MRFADELLHGVWVTMQTEDGKMKLSALDHLVLTVADIDVTVEFYGEVRVIEGPVKRTGAQGAILSIYLRDPDGNLIEVSNRL